MAKNQEAQLAVAGLDRVAKLGVAGLDRPQFARLGVAGINTRPLQRAALGVAGNLGGALRDEVRRIPKVGKGSLGDRAAEKAWRRVVFFPEWTYWVCPDGKGGFRFRKGFQGYAPEKRGPETPEVFIDSGAFRRFFQRTPKWDTLENYCAAWELIRPVAGMAYDVMHNQDETHRNYQKMKALGMKNVIPVWQVTPTWDDRATTRVPGVPGYVDEETRLGIANARVAAQDPRLRQYFSENELVGFGGMAKSRIPRKARVAYLCELHNLFPDNKLWGLAQASPQVINGIFLAGKLPHIYLDGTTWILMSMCDEFLVRKDGLLRKISLRGQAQSFFATVEKMAANLRAMAMQYEEDSRALNWPPPAPIPEASDLDGVAELHRRIQPETKLLIDLFNLIDDEEEGDAA